MNNSYLALTIGPIYKTFHNVRKTRELWAASFCFSFIMRKINEYLRNNGIGNEDFIMPYFSEETLKEIYNDTTKEFSIKGYGMFPDRIIFKKDGGGIALLESAIDHAFNALSATVSDVTTANKEDVNSFLRGYFQLSYIEKSLDEASTGNVILSLSPYLDTLEQQNKYTLKEPKEKYLFEFFKGVNKRKQDNDKEKKEAFIDKFYELTDANGRRKIKAGEKPTPRIESLIEISTRELEKIPDVKYCQSLNTTLWNEKINDDRDEEEITDEKNKKKKIATDADFLKKLIGECKKIEEKIKVNPFKSYHKYVCILTADGDSIGKTLRALSSEKQTLDFSDMLSQWAIETYKITRNYQAVPIYIGGDDLLCFAPVCNGEQNIFNLIDNISSAFNKLVKALVDKHKLSVTATLSFGLSITYYKFPLNEALTEAHTLLRKAKDKGKGDSIALKFLKHSGNELETILKKGSPVYKTIINERLLPLLNNPDALNNAVTYKLRENEEVIKQIVKDEKRVIHFVNNNFDVDDEGDVPYEEMEEKDYGKKLPSEQFMRNVKELIYETYQSKINKLVESNMDVVSKEAMKDIFSILRTVKFIKGLDDDKA